MSDETEYVGLGDQKGPVIAIGDFTCDRYSDLLVAQDPPHMRSVQVLTWSHHWLSFTESGNCSSGYQRSISLDSVERLSSEARIVTAATLDVHSDGLLDVLLSVHVSGPIYWGVLLRGDGNGCLRFEQTLSELPPGMLLLDANDDMSTDIFFISSRRERIFYINEKNGEFTRKVWRPRGYLDECTPTFPHNSNAFVDISGDCLPDLVVSTSCGLEVWSNAVLQNKSVSRWTIGQQFTKTSVDFSELQWPKDKERFQMLDSSVWNARSGDGMAAFADFNGDGSIDIGVTNNETRELRISYKVVEQNKRNRNLCTSIQKPRYITEVALNHILVPDFKLANIRLQGRIGVGDFNFDGKLDILLMNGDTGAMTLFEAQSYRPESSWFRGSRRFSRLWERIFFSVTGINRRERLTNFMETVRYEQTAAIQLVSVEDPLGAVFFDTDESGRQDILIPQLHGTRLLANNLKGFQDSVFFKATAVDSTHDFKRSPATGLEAFSPMPGNTFKLSYGGRHRREMHVCTQCPQTGFLSLQPCSCIFGITRVANYIEEMAMGGAHGVRTWKNLMPNALAIIWPQRRSSRVVSKWNISYLSKGRDGQLKRIAIVLFATLIILFFAILYAANLEKLDENNKLEFGYT